MPQETPHPIHRRIRAEELVRLRRASEHRRYAASQRRGRIDPNPHQINAVIFALERIPEGGCILADEVGLGKTIEAGLVIAQLLAEGWQRVLLILPKALLGQWQNELYTLFGIETQEGSLSPDAFIGPGVFLTSRDFAGSEKGSSLLRSVERFDLCVIDEAHEIFAGIHKRFDRYGYYKEDSKDAQMAHRVRQVFANVPKLLLTATPIQNSLVELWGLTQWIEPTGTLLGNLATFREVFCDGDDRSLVVDQAHELRRRISRICQRTLRRQAQEFLEKPFVDRRALLLEYRMSPEERQVYDDVTRYLLEPNICAFSGNQRQLLLISFHRLMASSLAALAASLRKVAERLEKMLAGVTPPRLSESVRDFALDLEDELPSLAEDEETAPAALTPEKIQDELERVQRFVQRVERLPQDGKAERLLDAVRIIQERKGKGSGKIVIFTESLTTQDHLKDILINRGFAPRDITLFRGDNASPRASEALERWDEEVGQHIPKYNRPSRSVAVRLALVHEFQTRSRVFISTEAGAKGLNLQFCNTLINYDLPWNPQRIEQRIGRCHRYGQKHDVTVINFVAKDNEAERLLFEILSDKLDLFGTVLDASDVVLHEASTSTPETLTTALGADFESRLRRIYERARTLEEIEEELRGLRETMEAKRRDFEQEFDRTRGLIETRIDKTVRAVFRQIQEELPSSLAQLDRDIDEVVTGYLTAINAPFERTTKEGRIFLELSAFPALPEELREGVQVAIGHAKDLEDTDPVHLGHPLVRAALEESRAATEGRLRARFKLNDKSGGPLDEYRHKRGYLAVTKVKYAGVEAVEHLVPSLALEDNDLAVAPELISRLLSLDAESIDAFTPPLSVTDEDIEDAIEESIFLDQARVEVAEQNHFERTMEQLERFMDDQVLVLRREQEHVKARMRESEAKRDAALGPDARDAATKKLVELEKKLEELETRIAKLEARDDTDYQRWKQHAFGRRYASPERTRILAVEFVIE